MPTEQEAKPAVVTPSLQQWKSPSTFRGAPGEDPLKWLKEQWYVNNEDALNSWEAFKNGLSGLFGDRQKYTRKGRRTTKMPSPAFRRVRSPHIQSVLGLCQEALLTREINDTASFIKWCNYIEDMKQKRVGRPRLKGFQTSYRLHPEGFETDLVSYSHNQEIVQDEVERVLAPVSTKPTETGPRPTYAAVTRKYRAPVQKFPPEPRKTDRERLSLTTLETADGTSTTLALKKKYADQTLLAVLRQVPREADPQYVVTDPRRHIADPVSRQAVGAGKTKESDLQGGEAVCTGNPPSTAKMTGNQLDVIIDKKPIRALVDSGASFSVISDKYRRFLKKVLFADAKSVMLKVADGNFVRPIGKCVLRVRINSRELPFEFIVLSHCSHDVILGWDFLEASQAVIDCGQNELVLEDICRDSTAPDAWNLYATRDYTLKPHSLTRITVSGYQTEET
ncbi:transposon Ty3-I Gag-Pol polyprotein [Trichonephila clavipes]|nr:transposon Ty3-I Gag-Pol polyprotein [Trichonephila clavipes]